MMEHDAGAPLQKKMLSAEFPSPLPYISCMLSLVSGSIPHSPVQLRLGGLEAGVITARWLSQLGT